MQKIQLKQHYKLNSPMCQAHSEPAYRSQNTNPQNQKQYDYSTLTPSTRYQSCESTATHTTYACPGGQL